MYNIISTKCLRNNRKIQVSVLFVGVRIIGWGRRRTDYNHFYYQFRVCLVCAGMRECNLFHLELWNVRRGTWQNDKVNFVLNVGSVPHLGDLAKNTRSFARIIVLIIDWE